MFILFRSDLIRARVGLVNCSESTVTIRFLSTVSRLTAHANSTHNLLEHFAYSMNKTFIKKISAISALADTFCYLLL